MPVEITIKQALVKRTVYSLILDPALFKTYLDNCIRIGKLSALYKDPNILIAFYNSGTTLSTAIQTAINANTDAPILTNEEQIALAMAAGLGWLNSYADQVEVIANLAVNRVTQEQAAINITQSNLSYQSLAPVSKGVPVAPSFAGEVGTGPGAIDININNLEPYNPSRTVLISISDPLVTDPITPPSIVSVVNGQMNIQTFGPSNISIVIIPGKGRLAKFKALVTGIYHNFYGFCSNGKNKNSTISAKVSVKL
jgi:hypothetical protein